MVTATFDPLGWALFPRDAALEAWLDHVRAPALATRHDPAFADWLRCDGTWFVGVNALGNDGSGAVAGSGPLAGAAARFIRTDLGFAGAFDRAQVSIVYPGYPRPNAGESAASFAFRRDRDAAHVDGLHPVGPNRRRMATEFQGFLLGVPLTDTGLGASPLVVWDGSHRIMAEMFRAALSGLAPETWQDIDLTDAYAEARRRVFQTCRRRILHARPGEAYVLHRFALHGVTPWQDGAAAPAEGRAILYFRPDVAREDWLSLP
jgi:hypothetical protein